jgi:hypothetical protein
MSERVAGLERKMENDERRRRNNNVGWGGEGKSKQQIKEGIENFIKENFRGN